MRRILGCIILSLIWIASMCALNVLATATSALHGQITDEEGGPVIGATVVLEGTTCGAATDVDGRYRIEHVELGRYTVRVSHLDFKTAEITGVVIESGQEAEFCVKLKKKEHPDPGATITVKCTHDILDRFEVTSTTTISRETIIQQPITTVDHLLEQVSGVQSTPEGEVFIRGGRAGEVYYVIDGVSAGDLRGSAPRDRLTLAPAHGGSAIVNDEPFDAMFSKHYVVNPFVDTEDDHYSTFAVDVDDASFSMTRSYLDRGALPPEEAVRVEEFVDHFDYNYDSPQTDPFSVHFVGAPSQFGNAGAYLLRVGIQGRYLRPEQRRDANLVFVIDVSGSMNREDRLELVKKALRMLVDELTARDRVGIVIYGSSGSKHMKPKSASERDDIIRAIEELRPGGSTNADQGLELGFEMANKILDDSKINRIILCSDGVANVGVTGAGGLLDKYGKYIKKGITLPRSVSAWATTTMC